ncbi:MAG: PCRF domain-containing protein [Phycisphaerales bacterium]|nr:PCRF domain-containing protein [Phycisphaerales bacterium]
MSTLADNLMCKLRELDAQYGDLEAQLLDPDVLVDHRRVRTLSIKKSALHPIVDRFRRLNQSETRQDEACQVIASESEAELVDLARGELESARGEAEQLAEELRGLLVTAEDRSISALILEIRAGVGGDEAALWAGDLLEAYRRYAADRGWTFNVLDHAAGDVGGCKACIIEVEGEGAWSNLCFEGGTHQVKRVPATEAQGRIHTSTATVAVLPQPEEVEVDLDPNDVKEMITTSTGPGGQNVNKVATAVHLIHGPTGIEVRMQDTKSQAQNRQKAWQLLRARLYEQQKAAADAERAEVRNSMIGSGSRAEKIRTYRAKDNLAVDHRLGSSFNLDRVLAGDMQPMIDELVELETARRLQAL